jgi:uncharacterized Zn finger protein
MGRESVEVKARRLLTEGRVDVCYRQGRDLRAVVRGDSGEEYEVGHIAGEWYCGCPAFGRCSHVMAVQLIAVVVRPASSGAPKRTTSL